MNLLIGSPVILIFLKWSGLLAFGWGAHALLRHRHARWRVLLWRGLLCAGLILPLTVWLPVPGIRIPVRTGFFSEAADVPSPIGVESTPLTHPAAPTLAIAPTKTFAVSTQTPSPVTVPLSKTRLLLVIWVNTNFNRGLRRIKRRMHSKRDSQRVLLKRINLSGDLFGAITLCILLKANRHSFPFFPINGSIIDKDFFIKC